jgi:mannose-6-phosphate isomerase-like protein (cupin superfamily)
MESSSYALTDIEAAHAAKGELWHEFLRVPDLSMGLYILPAGSTDPQSPHHEDEVYYIVSGRGTLTAGDREYPVGPGSILYVAKEVPHKFHDIEEDLHVLVFFAPAHSS